MTDKLKPCPFCGGKAYYYYERGNDSIVCEECGAKLTYFDFGDANDELVKQWNARPIEEEQGERIKHLQKKRVEALGQNYKNAFNIQKYALKENSRLRQALEVILDAAQKDEPCVLAIKAVAYIALKGDGE